MKQTIKTEKNNKNKKIAYQKIELAKNHQDLEMRSEPRKHLLRIRTQGQNEPNH